MIARYLVKSPTYVRLAPDDGESVHMAAGATPNSPLPIELPANVLPSRTWLPLNAAARDALAEIGVEAAIVREPGSAPRKEIETNLDANLARRRVVGLRASDVDPVTGTAAAPSPSRIVGR